MGSVWGGVSSPIQSISGCFGVTFSEACMQQAYNGKYTYLWAKFLLKMPELNTDQELTENQSEDTPRC